MALEFTNASSISAGTILSMMAVDVVVNEDSEVCILHDRNFPVIVDHIEYDHETGCLFFVDDEGRAIDFGMAVPRQNRRRFSCAREAHFLLVKGAKISGYRTVLVKHLGVEND